MSLKNVVKVMNFHSLLRVDRSRKKAVKYSQMETMVLEMLDNILNNRNIQLDVQALKPDTSKPELVILMGSDLGFCGNLNNLVRRTFLSEKKPDTHTVIIGRKLHNLQDENTVFYMDHEDFPQRHDELMQLLSRVLRGKEYSSVRLIYNHYKNATETQFENRVVLPMPKGLFSSDKNKYKEDFVFEGDKQEILLELTDLYLQYEVEIAAYVSQAAENMNRQSITTDSLKKIDERDEIEARQARREQKDKEFAKVLDNYTKISRY